MKNTSDKIEDMIVALQKLVSGEHTDAFFERLDGVTGRKRFGLMPNIELRLSKLIAEDTQFRVIQPVVDEIAELPAKHGSAAIQYAKRKLGFFIWQFKVEIFSGGMLIGNLSSSQLETAIEVRKYEVKVWLYTELLKIANNFRVDVDEWNN